MALFDAMYLIGSAEAEQGMTISEVNTLSYLACLMSIYDGKPSENWGYKYSVTEFGAPYSASVADAVNSAVAARWAERSDRVYRLTLRGVEELAFQASLRPNQDRRRYLAASVGAALSMPIPAIGDALAHEPSLDRALRFVRRAQLLDQTGLDMVIDQFADLKSALPSESGRGDLLVPTVVWLSFLARDAEQLAHP